MAILFFMVHLGPAEWPSPFSTVRCLTLKRGGSGSQAEWSSLQLPNVDAESVFFVVLLGRYLCCIVMFMFIYYPLTYLVSLNLQKR